MAERPRSLDYLEIIKIIFQDQMVYTCTSFLGEGCVFGHVYWLTGVEWVHCLFLFPLVLEKL